MFERPQACRLYPKQHGIFLFLCWLPRWLSGKESVCNTGNADLIPGWERSPGEGNGTAVQYSCLENPMNRGAWQATVQLVTKESDTTEQLTLFNLKYSNHQVKFLGKNPFKLLWSLNTLWNISTIVLCIIYFLHCLSFLALNPSVNWVFSLQYSCQYL